MNTLSRILSASLAAGLFVSVLAAADDPKDKITKGADGWYTVEFQVGTGKVKVEFPGEPKLESDPKAADTRAYSFANPKSKRRYFITVGEGHKGALLADKDDDGLKALGVFEQWKKDDPRYKSPKVGRVNSFGKLRACEVVRDEGKNGIHEYLIVRDGNLIVIGTENAATDAEEKRFLTSFVSEKGEAPKVEAAKVEVPNGWKELTAGKTGITVYSPVELRWFSMGGGDFGEHNFFLKGGDKKAVQISITKAKDPKELEAKRGTITAMVPKKAAKVTLGGVPGICTYKDGKPVGSDANFGYYAWIGNYLLMVNCQESAVAPADAEKMAVLIVQQLRDMK